MSGNLVECVKELFTISRGENELREALQLNNESIKIVEYNIATKAYQTIGEKRRLETELGTLLYFKEKIKYKLDAAAAAAATGTAGPSTSSASSSSSSSSSSLQTLKWQNDERAVAGMPDVTRSDSQRSDTSLRPRVSFNRDVHVKRIVPREGSRVTGALSGDGEGHLVASPVRKERLSKSKQELAKEAAEVLHQADKLDCVIQGGGAPIDKYYTLPARKKLRPEHLHSLDRKTPRRNSDETDPPRKPPRTFTTSKSPPRTSLFNLFKKTEQTTAPKKSNLRRSISDASNLKSRSFRQTDDAQPLRKRPDSETEENLSNLKATKKLSPIIEITQRDDYFTPSNKENVDVNGKEHVERDKTRPKKKAKEKQQSVTEQLKEYIDEVDSVLFNERNQVEQPERKEPGIVIIDVEAADQISDKKSGKSKSFTKKIKSLTKKSGVDKSNGKLKDKSKSDRGKLDDLFSLSPNIKEGENLEGKIKPHAMIHSSQKPVDKLPLTRGRAVDNIVKRLSHESSSPIPKTNILVSPNVSVQHNNNQPFSYTRGVSPDKIDSRSPTTKPIIYAQVVCNNNGKPNKQTIHTTYLNGRKNVPHSDSDEGLGYEESSGFNRKYDVEKSITHFGDKRYDNGFNARSDDFYNDIDRFEEEFPITPKFKNMYNGFGYEKIHEDFENKFNGFKTEQSMFIDSSSRGRGDGMDSKRRESLTEPEHGLHSKYNGSSNNVNGRTDLSARRDKLESRINRRFGEKTLRQSPEYSPKFSPINNVYITESTSRYYRSGSNSPVGYREKHVTETTIDSSGEKHRKESRSKKYFGDSEAIEHDRYKTDDYRYNSFDNEPKSFDSQISDYRSSPEHVNRHFETSHNYKSTHQGKYLPKSVKQQMYKDREYYKSNPEINQTSYDSDIRHRETYHDSLKREKHENRINSNNYHNDMYFDQTDSERKDKFGDSGIENDFRRDSGENFKIGRPDKQEKRDVCNDSEDEGFASSLLIASERQHTEDNFAKKRREYDRNNQRNSRERDDYRHFESMDYKNYKSKDRHEYAPRERSIDDGSHYDPRIDKEVDKGTLKKMDKKPPKPEKKSGLDKVKQLFSRDSKKKKEKERNMVREETLRARYTEYRGSREEIEPKVKRKENIELNSSYQYNNRRRLSTPSPSPTREPTRNDKPENTHGSWFKSLDRLARKKSKKNDKESNSTEDETTTKPAPTKNLRFFGDTDVESNDSMRKKSSLKTRAGFSTNTRERTRSQSTRDLHNITEEISVPEVQRNNHKSMLNISESDRDVKGSRLSLKPPMSPNHRHRDVSRSRDDRGRRRKNEVSSVESSTEGDSSQQSQRSVVYLHAATVGDIPGPGYLRNGRRAASREELTSNSSSRIQPQVKTLSRSFSVLAPWKPKHLRESMDIDYTQYPKPTKNGKYEQKVAKNGSSRKENTSTLKKKAQETKRSNQNVSTLSNKSRSKENVSSTLKRTKEELPRGSSSTLFKKKERQPKENLRYTNRDEKKISSKSMSVESLGGNRTSRRGREDAREVSRSISMPRDPEKSAGWFKMNKKGKKSGSTQRL